MKVGYPNFSDSISAKPVYNLNKWLAAMKDIYLKLHFGLSKKEATDQITKDWDKVEQREFAEWLSYYGSGEHLKYKKAQYYVNDDLNYFLPNPKSIPSPIRSINEDISKVDQEVEKKVKIDKENLSQSEKRKIIEDQRWKILGRLNSAEKLLSSQQGHLFAGKEFENILNSIYSLKKQIQTVNKLDHVSAQTMVDLIVRQANILKSKGSFAASEFMIKIAQSTTGNMDFALGEVPAGGSVPQGTGSLGNNNPNLEEESESAVDGFINNLDSAGLTDAEDLEEEDDVSFADDISLTNDDIVIDEANDDVMLNQEVLPGDIIIEAQEAPPAQVKTNVKPPDAKSVPATTPADLNISKEEVATVPPVAVKNDFDTIIDSAFQHLTVQDVINKLEDINKIFKTKEISRQLSIVELMMDRLGISSYFIELAEIQGRVIDSSIYSNSRLENIISKLTGSINKNDKIDLTNENKILSPEAENLKSSLQQEEDKEKQLQQAKKERRDQKDLQALKPEPTVESVPQDLAAQPAKIETPPVQPKP